MKALMYMGERKMELQELPMPKGDLILKVLGCAVCGTDLKTFLHGHPFFKPPTILGHEFYGQIEQVPEGSRFKKRDYVVAAPYGECGDCEKCREGLPELCENKDYVETGAFCEYVAMSAKFAERGLIRLDAPVPVYALTEPLACVLTGLSQLKLNHDKKVLVIGGGPMGALAAMTLMEKGIPVMVAELNPVRQEKLKEWGIPCDSLDKCYQAASYDRILVAVNIGPLVEEAVRKVKSGGMVHVFAGLPKETELNIRAYDLHYRFVCLTGSSGYALPAFRQAFDMIHRNPERYECLITHRYPLKEGQGALELLARGEAFKVLITP